MKKVILSAVFVLGVAALSTSAKAKTISVKNNTSAVSDKKETGSADLSDKKETGSADLSDKKETGSADLN